jgi:hypothetical protein
VAAAAGSYSSSGTWRVFNYNEDIGYTYTDFVYPGELISNIGDNVCSVLDTIVSTLGNFEYFYDVDGHFVFQEIRNYLNNSYNPTKTTYLGYKIDKETGQTIIPDYTNLCLIDDENYMVDYNSNSKSVYTFDEGNGLISSYNNNPNYSNMKNDYHIWGKKEDYAIHYHLAIKNKPTVFNKYLVKFTQDEKGEYTGQLSFLEEIENDTPFSVEVDPETGDYVLVIPGVKKYEVVTGSDRERTLICTRDAAYEKPETLTFMERVRDNVYIPTDWRAELYLRGLAKQSHQQRPDIYEQELLDNFDSIYNFYEPWTDNNGDYIYINTITGVDVSQTELDNNPSLADIVIIKRGKFKADIVNKPNVLNYFMDFLEPKGKYEDCSIDSINMRIYSYQQDKIVKLYDSDIPNVIILNGGATTEEEIVEREKIKNQCLLEGQTFSNVSKNIYNQIAENTIGYSAQETARELLYQYTNLNENISLQSVPIYYLDVNSRITVRDKGSNIYGDYVINSISIPLAVNGQMNINATKALERI